MSPLSARLLSIACVTAYLAASAVSAPVALLTLSAGCACALTVLLIPEVL